MSSLFDGGPKFQAPKQQPQMQAQQADMSAENAGLFERMRRAGAYGSVKTNLTAGRDLGVAPVTRKTYVGAIS